MRNGLLSLGNVRFRSSLGDKETPGFCSKAATNNTLGLNTALRKKAHPKFYDKHRNEAGPESTTSLCSLLGNDFETFSTCF